MTTETKEQIFVKKPRFASGKGWVVEVCDSPSPLANVKETIPCGSREGAYQAYRRIMKELGRGY